MLYYSGTEFLDLNPNDGMQVSNADSDGTTFTLRSRINSLDKTLKHLAQLMKEPLNMRETMAQKREVFKEYIEIASVFRASDRLFPLLGNFGHPSRNSGWGKMETLTNEKMNDDTFYRRIEEFKNRHYSAHRMSLCLETHLSLDEMQVRNRLKKQKSKYEIKQKKIFQLFSIGDSCDAFFIDTQ